MDNQSHDKSGMPPKMNRENFRAFTTERAHALHAHILAHPGATDGSFAADPLALVAAIEDFANTQRVPMIFRAGKMKVARGVLAAMDPPPRMLVEFGTYVGCSALAWGAALRQLNGNRDGNGDGDGDGVKVWTFEKDAAMAGIARDFIRLAGLGGTVEVVEGSGDESLRRLVGEGKVQRNGVDVVFFDHWEQLYVPDLRLCEELGVLRKGSVIMADNTDFPGAPDYLEYVKKGGSGEGVRYESHSLEAKEDGEQERPARPGFSHPKVVEVTIAVGI